MRRTILFLGVLSAVVMVSFSTRPAEADGTKYWAGLVGFQDCYYGCGNNQGDEYCTCTTRKLVP